MNETYHTNDIRGLNDNRLKEYKKFKKNKRDKNETHERENSNKTKCNGFNLDR